MNFIIFSLQILIRRMVSSRSCAAISRLSLAACLFLPGAFAGTISGTVSAPQGNVSGATITLSRGGLTSVSQLPSDLPASYTGNLNWLNLPNSAGNIFSGISPNVPVDYIGGVFTCTIFPGAPIGTGYTFYLNSDDGAKLYVDGVLEIDNDGVHPETRKSSRAIGFIPNTIHSLRVEYFENTGNAALHVSYDFPGRIEGYVGEPSRQWSCSLYTIPTTSLAATSAGGTGAYSFVDVSLKQVVSLTPSYPGGTFTPTSITGSGVGPFNFTLSSSPPWIGGLNNDPVINEDTPITVAFDVGDYQTAPGSLTVSVASSNPAVIPPGNVTISGSTGSRTATIIPAPNAYGSSTLTFTVTDGESKSASTSFLVTVMPVNDTPVSRPDTSRPADQVIVIPGFGLIAPTNEVTIEFWQLTTAQVVQSTFRLDSDVETDRINAHVPYSDGAVWWDWGPIYTGGRLWYTPSVSPVGNWVHFAFVASQGGNYMKIFRNGVEEAYKSGMVPFVRRAGDLSLNGVGRLADFRIWNVARTATEIAENMGAPVPPGSFGLIVNYRFEGTTGLTVRDLASSSGNPSQAGAQDGVIQQPYSYPWANTDGALAAKLGLQVSEDSSKLVYIPGFDVETASLIYGVTVSTGKISQVSVGNFLYTPPPGQSFAFGTNTISWAVGDGTNTASSSLKLQVNAINDPPVVGPGTALGFDGATQYLDFPDGTWFGNAFTVEGWVFLRSYGNWPTMFDFGNGSDNDNVSGMLGTGTSGMPAFFIIQGAVSQSVWSSQALPLNTWTHLAFTRDDSGIGHIFINGTDSAAGGIWAPRNVTRTNNVFGRGNWSWGGSEANAKFAELRIWNVARTAQQLSDSRHASLSNTTPGLIAAYHLNEGSGTTAFDAATGNGAQNATLINDPSWLPVDGPTTSIAFNGTSQYSSTLDASPISITGPITVEAWIRPAAIGTIMGIVEKYGASDGGYFLRLDASGRVQFSTLDGGAIGNNDILTGNRVLAANVWTHVAGQWDGTQLRIYVDGVLDASSLVGRNPKDGATPLIIGATGLSYDYKFNGRIGDVRLWNVARTPAEIAAWRGGVPSNAPGLVLNYLFNEGSGSTLTDVATADGVQNGTLTGSPTWPGPEATLPTLQVVKYTEDVPLDLVLPAFDIEGGTLVYSGFTASTGAVTQVSGSLFHYSPPTLYNGAATITYSASDGVTTRSSKVFLQGIAVEDAPTLAVSPNAGIPDQTIDEGSATAWLTINVTDGDPELTQALIVTATSSNTNLVRNPVVTYTSPAETAQLSYKPRPGCSGVTVITVVVTEPVSGLSTTKSFNLTVTAVDDFPNVGPATSLQFNGTNYVKVAGFGAIGLVDEITIEFWQYDNGLLNVSAAMSTLKPDNSNRNNNVAIRFFRSLGWVFWDFGDPINQGRLTYTPPVSITNSWQHFAFVASRSGNYMKIFRNGIEEATKPTMTPFVMDTSDLILGKFDGQLAEFRVWKVARTGPEILSSMYSSIADDTWNLVNYYRFNQKPTTVLVDFASLPAQGGSQDGQLISDSSDNDPIWNTPTWSTPAHNPSWQTSDPALLVLQTMRITEGASTNVFLPAWDPENGLGLTWFNVSATTGTVAQVSGSIWTYTAPVGHAGPAIVSYSVRDSANHVTSASINLRVVMVINNVPTIASIPNVTAEEDSALIEIPFIVDDDQEPSALIITPVLLSNAQLIQSVTVSPGGNFRTLNVVPKAGEIGTVHIRLRVQDAYGKSAEREFDLRIEPKPAFKVFDLGVIPGKAASFATSINDRGAVAGYMADTVDLESNPIAFFFNGVQNGGVVENNPPVQVGSNQFRAFSINNSYILAGAGKSGGTSTNAWFKGIEDAALSSLGALPGGSIAEARALNDAGYLAGFSTLSGGKKHAFLYTPGAGALTDLGTAPAPFNDQSDAFGVNASNHVVGSVYASNARRRAMLLRDGAMLPLLNVPDDTNSVAYALNSFDQVVGSTTTFAVGDHALSFDGINDSVTLTNLLLNPSPGTPLVAGKAAHSVEAWIQVKSMPVGQSWPLLLGTSDWGSQKWVVNDPLRPGLLSIGEYYATDLLVSVPVTLGAWMHVATTYDPARSTLSVYVNGQLFGTNSAYNMDLKGIPLTLGKPQNSDKFFHGALDEVRVWRTIRTAAEIAANYTKRLAGTESGLVAYLPFDEGSGTAHTTSADQGRLVGALAGDPEWAIRGGLPSPNLTVNDPALQLDGASSYATLPSLPLANSSFTIEFRARRFQTGTKDIAVSQGWANLGKGLYVGFLADNTFDLGFYDGNDLLTPAYTDTDWHHWASTLNVTNGARRIYRDGALVAQDTTSSAFSGSGPVVIGNAPFVSSTWFGGLIDEVRIWNVARSAEQIAANVDTRVPGDTPGLISSHSFDEGGGDIAVNRVLGGASATLQGAVGWAGRDTGTRRSFFYDTGSGHLSSLGTLPGGGPSEARAINDFGQIAGTSVKGAGSHGFFYSAGRLNDLADLLPEVDQLDQWNLESASGINRDGAIVGTGTHYGLKRAFLALPATVIGRPVIRPEGAVERYPDITILKKHLSDDSVLNSFYWSESEKKLYAIRPVTARMDWYTSLSDITGSGVDVQVITNRITSVTVNVWPRQPIIHIAGTPVDLQPAFTGAHYTFESLIYVTNRAAVEPSSKVFTSQDAGYTVAYYLKTDGLPANPLTQRPYFDVIRTVDWQDSHAALTTVDWTIGSEVTDPRHSEYDGKNGYVLFPQAAYDAVGADRAYDRGTRIGPVLPVNIEKPGGNLAANPDPLVVVWYRTNRIGVAWASMPVRYSLRWPADDVVDRIVIASMLGSGELSAAFYPSKTLYNQPDITQPGFNPNEEHGYMPVDTLYALRDDLNAVLNYSQPYSLLKYRDPSTSRWRMRVFKVVAEQAPYFFTYAGTVGKEIQPPLPLSLMPLCDASHRQPPESQVGWEDYKGKVYAKMAGPDGTHTNLMVRWFYPMQSGFYHPDSAVKAGDCLAWLDRHPASVLRSPNAGAPSPGTPIDVTYDIRWDDHSELQVGETLIHSKHNLPDVFNMANARVIFDSLSPADPAGDLALARFYDPISARTITSGVLIPATIKRQNINGKEYFIDLPWMLKLRLTYDPINNWLSFSGYLDENFGVGEPLLLPNVLSERERDRLKQLADGDGAWAALIDRIFDLTRNPHGVHLHPPGSGGDSSPDKALRLGLTTNALGKVVTEAFGDGPKVLTAGLGGLPAATTKPGNALSFNNGLVTVGPNGGQPLSLANTPFTIEFWAKVSSPSTEQYLLGQPGGSPDFGQLRIGFRAGGKFAFDLGTTPASASIFNTSAVYTDTDWHHWACTFDPESKVQSIYRDGLLIDTRTNLALTYSGVGALELGRFGTQYFGGQLDEIRVWKTARTGAEIRARMNKRLLGAQTASPAGAGSELKLEILFRCDEASGPLVNASLATQDGYVGTLTNGVSRVASGAPTGIPPRYLTIAENDDPSLGGLPVALHVIRVDDGPFLGDLKVMPGDNVFDERQTLRHSSDFGGDPGPLSFQWYYKPIGADFDPTDLPIITNRLSELPADMRGWTRYSNFKPLDGHGVNFITLGEGAESGLVTLSDNAFICRYRGYAVNLDSASAWSDWVGDPAGTPDQPRAVLAEGWVKRVIRGLNPFDARTSDFHSSAAVTFSSMLIQLGQRYEGPIAFNPAADAINKVGLIEAYTTVLQRAEGLSIDGVPQVDFNPANNALLLAATKLSDFYTVLGNEAYADASDPTIGFGLESKEYGSLSSSIFSFQNQLDSQLEEELTLLRGRDDSAAGTAARPVYNRLFWNFTLGEGEVAYQQNYNISDQDKNGFIDEKDARILYPQGHGDAWGHYLQALKQQYALLRHPYFTWIPRSELVSVAGTAVKVDFLDERKFASAAAAKARAGAEIVDLTYRLNYVEDPEGQWQGYKDTKTDRAWGVTEWARRAGLGAYFDWITGNTILPSTDPNPNHAGIDKIDRQTVRELQELPAQFDEIQSRLDQADAGLNPLGLAKGVVSFDIDPSLVVGASGGSGKTHYEQIQDRALKSMNNALSVWDQVNKATQLLRQNQDSVEQFASLVDDQESDYRNRLIEIYGYPYAGDIGAGKTYPSGYDGPDLYHYMYAPIPDFDGRTYPNGPGFTAFFTRMGLGASPFKPSGDTQSGALGSTTESFFFPEDFASDLTNPIYGLESTNRILTVDYPTTTARYAFAPPAAWGQRRAPGELQMALSDMIQTEARLRAVLASDSALLADISDRIDLLNARYAFRAEELKLKGDLANVEISLGTVIAVSKIAQQVMNGAARTSLRLGDIAADGFPKVLGLASDVTSVGRVSVRMAALAVAEPLETIGAVLGGVADVTQKIGLETAKSIINGKIQTAGFTYEIKQQVSELEHVIHQEAASRLEGLEVVEKLRQTTGRYLAALAKGQRLVEERVSYRTKVAARTTESRYQDMTFRIFRNDALQKYRATFDLAQRYVFLAATAYDYESNLLGSDTRGGRAFLTDIIRQRSLGQMLNGVPVVGRAGLADPLARMSGNFDVLKTQLGFNNPQTETDRFSLRNELFRLKNSSDADWRAQLRSQRVANLWDLPEFRRYCRSFAPESAGRQPAIVIRFPTTVTAGRNFFNWPLGGGDSAYDPSRFATRVRSAGIWFSGYNGLGLSQTPRVYLIPTGAELLSSPTPNDFVTREWRVVDQALPVPFSIGANSLNSKGWIPINDSLGGSFADIRRFASFRAYHDSGEFNPAEATTDSRLIGRSVWNKDWILIIPGQTFLADGDAGLDAFIASVSDIKLFFQTYSYSGN